MPVVTTAFLKGTRAAIATAGVAAGTWLGFGGQKTPEQPSSARASQPQTPPASEQTANVQDNNFSVPVPVNDMLTIADFAARLWAKNHDKKRLSAEKSAKVQSTQASELTAIDTALTALKDHPATRYGKDHYNTARKRIDSAKLYNNRTDCLTNAIVEKISNDIHAASGVLTKIQKLQAAFDQEMPDFGKRLIAAQQKNETIIECFDHNNNGLNSNQQAARIQALNCAKEIEKKLNAPLTPDHFCTLEPLLHRLESMQQKIYQPRNKKEKISGIATLVNDTTATLKQIPSPQVRHVEYNGHHNTAWTNRMGSTSLAIAATANPLALPISTRGR